MFLANRSHIKHIAAVILLAVMLGLNYWLIGKSYPLLDFGMKSLHAPQVFVQWVWFFVVAFPLWAWALIERNDMATNRPSLPRRNVWIFSAVFLVFLFAERSVIYDFWAPIRIDFEQHMWVAIGQDAHSRWLGKGNYGPFSIWAGWYNSLYGYLLAVTNFVVSVDSWASYRTFSVVVTAAASVLMIVILNRVFGKVAVIFFACSVLFCAYINFSSFYMKHHILMLFFYALIMFFVFEYWKKQGLVNAVLLSLSCLIAFIAYVGAIYYLPVALLGVLFSSADLRKKILPLFLVGFPTSAFLGYLLLFPEKWPSDYFMHKAIWHHPNTFSSLVDNAVAEAKFLFVPGSIWGWLIQACFLVGVAYTVKSRQKETWIWLLSLLMAVGAMLTSWDREMGHNFITIFPYAAIAAFGASQLWYVHFSFSRLTKVLYGIIFTVGFGSEIYSFALSERWMNYAVFDLATPLNNRIWFFDDAKRFEKWKKPTMVADEALVNQFNNTIARADTDINKEFGFMRHFSDFKIYQDVQLLTAKDQFAPACNGLFLTEKPLEQAQAWFDGKAQLMLLEKYRPANPRYDYLPYQPNIFHYMYEFTIPELCKG